MNYLAHAHLSFDQPEILTGNMISDFVKGKQRFAYHPSVQRGITMHRIIDMFTDSHPEIRAAKTIFRPAYGLYASPIVDVCMDFFLANDPSAFSDPQSLEDFSLNTYLHLEKNLPQLPERFRQLFPSMKANNWLYNYRLEYGIERSLAGLVRRAKFMTDHRPAFDLFIKHQSELKERYDNFYPQLKNEALRFLAEI
jgi:acyl carrier protein phosphodiesterase